jgi:hypothetical protein
MPGEDRLMEVHAAQEVTEAWGAAQVVSYGFCRSRFMPLLQLEHPR